MRIGGDTGLLIGAIEQADSALAYWQNVLSGEHELAMSTLTICELLAHYYKRGKGETARKLTREIRALSNVQFVPVDHRIAERAAGYRYGLGIPTVDATVLATCVEVGCDLVLTTDSHFQIAADQGIANIEFVR